MKLRINLLILLYTSLHLCIGQIINNNSIKNIIIIEEPGFPVVETEDISFDEVKDLIKGEKNMVLNKVSFDEFASLILNKKKIDLLVWKYGSSMNEKIWSSISSYLHNGGNIFVTGGRPFFQDIVGTSDGYQNKRINNRFSEQLYITDAYPVSIEGMKKVIINADYNYLQISDKMKIRNAYTLLFQTFSDSLPNELSGNISCKNKTIVSAIDSNGENSIPIVCLFDRYRGEFIGGRWVFFTFTPETGFWKSAEGKMMFKDFLLFSLNKPIYSNIEPSYAFYKPGEKAEIAIHLKSYNLDKRKYDVEITLSKADKTIQLFDKVVFNSIDSSYYLQVKPNLSEGLYKISLLIKEGKKTIHSATGGFLCDNPDKLNTGLPFGTNSHFITRGGKSFPVTGMTYMDGENNRFFLKYPNPVLWDKEMREMKETGVNMIRTGLWWWYPYQEILNSNNEPNEKTLRALDAFLSTAKRYDLPVQYCLFPFQPLVKDSEAPFTDDKAFETQKQYINTLAQRYKNNPDIIWDLINEPSYGKAMWLWSGNVPTNSQSEQKLWNDWLKTQYNNRTELLPGMLNMLPEQFNDKDGIALPNNNNLSSNNFYYKNQKPLIAYDYNLFAQYAYNNWARKIRQIYKDAGSKQLIVTGQDEGGVSNRVLNQFYAEESDFTTMHSWWQDDDLLWSSITGKAQNKPLLVQETNLMRFVDPREQARRNELEYMKTLERKLCIAFGAEGAGVIPWVWNANPNSNENESSIGILRCDGTASPEKLMYKRFSSFINRNTNYFTQAKNADILMVIPLSLQLSNYNGLAVGATKNAIRALHYYAKLQEIAASEYHLDRNNYAPKLIILPSPLTLSDKAWTQLLKQVDNGATLLVTGPVCLDPHFEHVDRLSKFQVEEETQPITLMESTIQIGNEKYPLNYYSLSPMKTLNRMVWKSDHEKVKTIFHGKGKILVTEYPCELNTNLNTTAKLYQYAAEIAGVKAKFTTNCTNPGILIRTMDYENARLYLLESETDRTENISFTDIPSGKAFNVELEAGRAKLLLISIDGKLIDSY